MEKVVVVQAEATSASANTVGIVEIRQQEVNRSCCNVEIRQYKEVNWQDVMIRSKEEKKVVKQHEVSSFFIRVIVFRKGLVRSKSAAVLSDRICSMQRSTMVVRNNYCRRDGWKIQGNLGKQSVLRVQVVKQWYNCLVFVCICQQKTVRERLEYFGFCDRR